MKARRSLNQFSKAARVADNNTSSDRVNGNDGRSHVEFFGSTNATVRQPTAQKSVQGPIIGLETQPKRVAKLAMAKAACKLYPVVS